MDNTFQEVEKLNTDARNVKAAHFIASQNKQNKHKILGVSIIVLNIIIFSPIPDFIPPGYVTAFIKILAIISASLAAFQTFLNYQKEFELHLNAGETYTSIYRKSRFLLANYKDKLISDDDFLREAQNLRDEYLKANNNYKNCVPTDKEYSAAVKSNQQRSNK